MWIVGIIAVALFAWWWAAQQRASQRLKMRVAIRTGVRAAFERWRSPDNDQIMAAIYEAARPTPLSLAQLDALVRPGLSQIVAELEEDGTIKSGDASPKEKPKRVASQKPSAANEADAERLQAQSARSIKSGDASPKEKPKPVAAPKPSAANEADAERLQAELARSMMTFATMATFKALLVDQEVDDGAIEEQVYEALRANLASSDSATSKGLSAALTREKARSWGSAVAHFYRTRAATAVAVVANKDPQAPFEEVVAFAVLQVAQDIDKAPWEITEDGTTMMMDHLVKHYQAEMDASPRTPEEWWTQFQKGYDDRYNEHAGRPAR